jgi:hypothetical protein
MLLTWTNAFDLPKWFSSVRGRGGDFSAATNHKMLQIFFRLALNISSPTWSL